MSRRGQILAQYMPMQPLDQQPGAANPPTAPAAADTPPARPRETGGPTGPEPTRYGDWERKGRCIDF